MSRPPRRRRTVARPVPWFGVVKDLGGTVMMLAGIVGLGWGLVVAFAQGRVEDSATIARIAALERWSAEMVPLPARINLAERTAEAANAYARQNIEMLRDQTRILQQADSQAADKMVSTAQSITAVLTRVEDVLRRLDGIERRLDRSLYPLPPAQRGGGDIPALWPRDHQTPAT